ncbi:MAG: DUF402 domain-containing protein [Haloarculaceae archaeon]
MTVRIRGIYATALTRLLTEVSHDVVQASPPIRERFDATFGDGPAAVDVATTDDRQGVAVAGDADGVTSVAETLAGVARDAFRWTDSTPRDAVFDGVVTETLGSGAVVDLGGGEGFLPYDDADDHVSAGDCLRVQVREPAAPWANGRHVLDASVALQGGLVTLTRGSAGVASSQPELAALLPTDPPEGWRPKWGPAAEDASLDALDDALERVTDRAESLSAALADVSDPTERAPSGVWTDPAMAWVWFGREARFALDEYRRAVETTMPGHHRVKAADRAASAAVDLVESICPAAAGNGEVDFPFGAVTRQFGPTEGDAVRIDHGKPDGRCFSLGEGEVVERDPATGKVTVERALSGGGTYDALGTDRERGDVATTTLTEGKWWYPTIYRGDDGTSKGTYVNVCTPVEMFPDAVRYVDLHVDVIKRPDGTVERVDDDELDAAVEAGHVGEELAEKARAVASAIENAL